ncbi:GNAT family N-acetyltransferase [Bacterioplanoides sp.]|uniref:GNAT family N-acetyltransferase n=1 Tax=Bacterioplanoides sp. TaxID=2066072 RepID=UPI003B00D62F
MMYLLRPVVVEDDAFLAELYISTRWQEVQQVPWKDEQRRDFLLQQFAAQTAHYHKHFPEAERYVIEVNHMAAGRLYIDDLGDELRIVDIALLPAFCGQGVGTQLLTEIFCRANAERKSVGIHVEKNNPALKLYQRLGFVQEKDVGVYWFMRRQLAD